MVDFTAEELRFYADFRDILDAQRPLPQILKEASLPLQRLISMDYGAACVTRPGGLQEYDWFPWDLSEEVFSQYRAIADRDFIRKAATAQPGVVLRDSEMLPRKEMEASLVYRSCRKLGLVMNQVMTVLLPFGQGAHGGMTLYRDRRVAFSDREREILKRLRPAVASTLSRHYLLEQAAFREAAFEALLGRDGAALVVLNPSGDVGLQSSAVDPLIERWFSSVERSRGRIPEPLFEWLRRAAADQAGAVPKDPWVRCGRRGALYASVMAVPRWSRRAWLVVLKERRWPKALTQRESEVVEKLLKYGKDNEFIATELGCTVATLKKHLQRIFQKLAVESRAQLIVELGPSS